MAVRTDVLLHNGFSMVAGVTKTLATVGAGEVWLVRSIILLNRTGGNSTVVMGSLRTAVTARWAQGLLVNITPLNLHGLFYVAEEGDVITMVATASGSHDVAIYGSRLILP